MLTQNLKVDEYIWFKYVFTKQALLGLSGITNRFANA